MIHTMMATSTGTMVVSERVFTTAALVDLCVAMASETPHQVSAALKAAAISQALNRYQACFVSSRLLRWVMRLAMPAKSSPQKASAIKVDQGIPANLRSPSRSRKA